MNHISDYGGAALHFASVPAGARRTGCLNAGTAASTQRQAVSELALPPPELPYTAMRGKRQALLMPGL